MYLFLIIIIIIIIYFYYYVNKIEHFSKHVFFDKCYVINLNQVKLGKDRWYLMKTHPTFKKHIIRYQGIYGKKYNFNKELNDKILTSSWNIGKWKGLKSKYIKMTVGEMGCILSHYYLWKKIVKNKIKKTLILEDDANKVIKKFINIVNGLIKYIPSDWDIFLIGFWLHKGNNDTYVNKYISRVKDFVMMHCYLVSQRGATKLISLTPINAPLDTWMSMNSDKLNIYRHNIMKDNWSSLISQNSYDSFIYHTNNW
jgi:GR25 family glycosyltransferase involved in LPS biosynthesis